MLTRRTISWLTTALLVFALLGVAPAALADPVSDSAKLREEVTLKNIRKHQAALQAIADANGGTHAAGTAGYDQSVDYVVKKLREAGYSPHRVAIRDRLLIGAPSHARAAVTQAHRPDLLPNQA